MHKHSSYFVAAIMAFAVSACASDDEQTKQDSGTGADAAIQPDGTARLGGEEC